MNSRKKINKYFTTIICLLIAISGISQNHEFGKFNISTNTGLFIKGKRLAGDYPDDFIDDFKALNPTAGLGINVNLEWYLSSTNNQMGIGFGYGNFAKQHAIPIFVAIRSYNNNLIHNIKFGGAPFVLGNKDQHNIIINKDYREDNEEYEINFSDVEISWFIDYGIEKAIAEKVNIGASLRYAIFFNTFTKSWTTTSGSGWFKTIDSNSEKNKESFHSIYPNLNISLSL